MRRQAEIQQPAPRESVEQKTLMQWARFNSAAHPELRLLYHVPNEGLRSYRTGSELKAQGMKAGVPDICLPVARGGYHSLYIELKRRKGGKVSEQQQEWLEMLNKAGNKAIVCKGWEEAAEAIVKYLKGGITL